MNFHSFLVSHANHQKAPYVVINRSSDIDFLFSSKGSGKLFEGKNKNDSHPSRVAVNLVFNGPARYDSNLRPHGS
jgi:hypothetical protein